MAIEFEKSKTKENLMKAFAGESQARNRYTIAAKMAEKQGMHAVAKIFLLTADQERSHAGVFYRLLKPSEGTTIDICGGFPVDTWESLVDLLKASEHNEMEEYQDVYQEFGNVAKEEGLYEAASAFYQIAEIEQIHAKRFRHVRELLEQQRYFQSDGQGAWMCLNCGYIHEGGETPDVCPVCREEKGHFIPLALAPFSCSVITKNK